MSSWEREHLAESAAVAVAYRAHERYMDAVQTMAVRFADELAKGDERAYLVGETIRLGREWHGAVIAAYRLPLVNRDLT